MILLFPKYSIKIGDGKDVVNSIFCVYFLSRDKDGSLNKTYIQSDDALALPQSSWNELLEFIT